MTFDIGLHEVCVRTGVRYVITKFSGMDRLPNFLTHGAPPRVRGSSAKNDQYQIPPCITTLLLQNKEWEIAGIEHSPLRFRRLRFTAHTGAIEQLVPHSITSKNKPHAHHETHLHAMKEVVTILIPSFQGVR